MNTQTKSITMFLLMALSISAQTISISGKVLKENGKPLKNCTVSLRKAKIHTTTNSSGEYTLEKGTVAVTGFHSPVPGVLNNVNITGNKLRLILSKSENVKASLFDIQGKNINAWSSGKLAAGSHSFGLQDILFRSVSSGVYIVSICIGQDQYRYILSKSAEKISISRSMNNSMQMVSADEHGVASTTAAVDTIDFKATGYKSKAFTISKYIMNCQDVTLEELPDEPQSIPLSTSLLKGKWACIFYDQDGCEDYFSINNYSISNMTLVPSTANGQFIGTWGTWDLAGGIIDQKNLLIILSRSDAVFNYQDIRIIALTQSHPVDLLAGSVFSGIGVMGRFNLTTGQQLCMGSCSFMMVRDFTDIGGTSTSSGSTYNPSKTGFESNQSTCLQRYLNCSKACSIGIYGLDDTSRYSDCIDECNAERDDCER